MKQLVAVFFVLFLSACASTPLPTDYGRVMTTEECKSAAMDYFNRVLKDPGSAKYRWSTCDKRLDKGGLLVPAIAAYNISIYINAKNSYGGYTGEKGYSVFVRNGSVVRVWDCSGERCELVL